MRVLAIWIEHPLYVTVQSPHDADAREHRVGPGEFLADERVYGHGPGAAKRNPQR
jgi:hypothetical protein